MGGLLEAIAVGTAGGVGKGMAENAQEEMKFNYDQMRAELDAAMNDRIYERGRADKSGDLAAEHENRMEEIAAQRDPNASALHAEQLKQLRDSNKLPPAVKASYDTLAEQNKLISSSIYKAQAEGTYNPETAAKAEAQMTENNRRMGELLKPYLGESAPKESAGIDLSAFDKGKKPAEQAKPAQPQAQSAGKSAMSAQETNTLLQQARDIKAKYGNKVPSKYFSGGLSENEQAVIDAADKASPGWRNF